MQQRLRSCSAVVIAGSVVRSPLDPFDLENYPPLLQPLMLQSQAAHRRLAPHRRRPWPSAPGQACSAISSSSFCSCFSFWLVMLLSLKAASIDKLQMLGA
jgi:hypothetical protein